MLAAAAYFQGHPDHQYPTPRVIEHIPLADLQAIPTSAMAVYKAMENALWETGTKVGSTVGDLMAAFGADQSQFNRLVCYCQNGDTITGSRLASNLRELAANKT